MRYLRAALSTFSLIVALPATAQDPRGKPINAPAGYLPGTAIYCDDGTNHAVLCAFGGGSGANATSRSSYAATVSGTGYNAGDLIDRVVNTSPISGAITSAYWINITQGTLLSTAPAAASLTSLSTGAATAARQDSLLAALGSPYQAGGALPLPAGAATAAGVATIVTTLGSPYQAGGALPLPAGAATAAAQAANTAAITATQASTGALAATATTVMTTLPQLTSSAGLATAFGTTAATLFNANTGRHFIVVQVQGSTGGCYINGAATATADANSLYIPAGGYFESATHVGTGAVSIICSAASTPVYSRQG